MSIETIDRIADVTAGSNSLPVLAARIRHYHAATAESLRCSVENAMCAGDALLEAKIAVPHGQWLPWLAEHCKLSERSAQLYMQIARNREAIEAKFTDGVEDLTLNQAAGLMMLTADVKKALEWARKLQMINDPEKVVHAPFQPIEDAGQVASRDKLTAHRSGILNTTLRPFLDNYARLQPLGSLIAD